MQCLGNSMGISFYSLAINRDLWVTKVGRDGKIPGALGDPGTRWVLVLRFGEVFGLMFVL